MRTALRPSVRRLLPALAAVVMTACAAQTPKSPEELASAQANLSAVIAANPANLSARRRLADLAFDSGQYGLAAEHYQALRAARPRDPRTQLQYGLSLIGTGRVDEGYDVLQGFTHPTIYRISQFVRERAAELRGRTDVPAVRASLRQAWAEGERMDWEERIDDRPFGRRIGPFLGGSAFGRD